MEAHLGTTTLDHAILLERLRQHWDYLGVDVDRAHEMYHEDAVLEFPQSGERLRAWPTSGSGAVNIRLTCASGSDR